jgi:hypothetical protein
MMRGMVIDMNDEQLQMLAQLQAFLDGTVALDLAVAAEERYDFIVRTVRRFGYRRLKRADQAVVLRFLERVSGYSRQQLTRLVKRGAEARSLTKRYRAPHALALRAATRTRTCACSPTPIPCTARSRAWPRRSSWSVPIASLPIPVMRA